MNETKMSLAKAIVASARALKENWEEVAKAIYRFRKAMLARILILQCKNEIKKVEQLLKYTKHSKKRQEHERYLKWLRKQLERLANDSTNDNIIDNISAITIDNINAINRCEEGGSV